MADQRSFADKVLDALESGEWQTWTQLMAATGLTLFWVRESLAELVECGLVEMEVREESVFVYRLDDAQVREYCTGCKSPASECVCSGPNVPYTGELVDRF